MSAHVLEHVAVAHRRSHQFDSQGAQVPLEAEIGHDGGHHTGALKPAVFFPTLGDDRYQLVAVDNAAALIHDHHPISVTIERDTDIGTHLTHLVRQRVEI